MSRMQTSQKNNPRHFHHILYDECRTSTRLFACKIFAVCLLSIILLLLLPACGKKTDTKDVTGPTQPTITFVKIDTKKNKIRISAEIPSEYAKANKGINLYLFELEPYENIDSLSTLEPVRTLKTNANISADFELYTGTRSRLFSSFVIAEKTAAGEFLPLTAPKYIENPEILAQSTFPYPKQSTKKGLTAGNLSDAQVLGAAHTVLTVDLARLLRPNGGQGTQSHVFSGVTYYLDKDELTALDYDIKISTEAGINVYLNIVLGAPADNLSPADLPQPLASLYFKDALPTSGYYAINVENETGASLFESIISFLSERYTKEKGQRGFAGGFIIGYESNIAQKDNTEEYISSYIKLIRIADTAHRANYSNGRIYISLNNIFTSDEEPENQTHSTIPIKDFLNILNEKIAASGNIPWNIAINPSANDKADTLIWKEPDAQNNLNTPLVTMHNINVLTDFLSADKFVLNGELRRVIVSEFAVFAAPQEEDGNVKAAAFAYAYYSAHSNNMIDAFIFLDNAGEEGESVFSGDSLAAKNVFATVFADIDMLPAKDVTDFALDIIGVTNWASIIPGFTEPGSSATVILDSALLPESKGYRKSNEILHNFTEGSLHSFYPSDNAEYVELKADEQFASVMYAKLADNGRYGRMGISRYYPEGLNLKRVKNISLMIKIDTPDDIDNAEFLLLMKKEGSPDKLYEGSVLTSCGKWVELNFDIRAFVKETGGKIDLVKLLVIGDNSGDKFGLSVENVSLYRSSLLLRVIVSLLLIVLLLVLLGFIYTKKRRQQMLKIRAKRIGGAHAFPLAKPYSPHSRTKYIKPIRKGSKISKDKKESSKKNTRRKDIFGNFD